MIVKVFNESSIHSREVQFLKCASNFFIRSKNGISVKSVLNQRSILYVVRATVKKE